MTVNRQRNFPYPEQVDSIESVGMYLKSLYRSLTEEQVDRILDFEDMVIDSQEISDLTISTSLKPTADNAVDIGATTLRFKDFYLAGNLNDDTVTLTVANAKTAYDHSQIAGGNSVHVSTTENTQWDTAYSHSQIAGGDSVHVSTTENTNWDSAYSKRVDTWGDGLQISSFTASVDYNTTNLKITSTELDTIQGISTAANPTFAGMNLTAELDITMASTLLIDLNPSYTGTGNVMEIIPSAALNTVDAVWEGIIIDCDALDPSVAGIEVHGVHIDLSGVDKTNNPHTDCLHLLTPSGLGGDHALHSDGEVHIDVDGTSGAAGEEYTAIDVVIATTGSTGGDMHALDVARSGAGSLSMAALGVHEGIDVIHHETGTFGNADKIWEYDNDAPGWTDVTTGTVSIWDDKDDLLYVGHGSVFSEIKFIFSVVATKDMHFKFYFSTGSSNYTQFFPADDTDGATQNGSVRYTAASLSTWATDTVNGTASKYWIKIERTRTSGTGPTATSMQQLAPTEYSWTSSGAITALSMNLVNTITEFSTDGTMGDNSNSAVPTEAAVKTYAQPLDAELTAIAGLTSTADRYIRYTGSGTADLRTYANVLADIGAAASSHAMSTHSDEDTYNISTSGTLGAGNATLGTISCGSIGIGDGDTVGNVNANIAFDGTNQRFIMAGDIIIPDDAYIGSASFPAAIQIEGDGDVVMSQDLAISGTLGVTGIATLATGSTIGNLTLANGSITDSSNAISFGNEALSTTGTLSCGALTSGNIIIPNAGTIGSTSDTDAIQIEADGDVVLTQSLGVGITPNAAYELHVLGDVALTSTTATALQFSVLNSKASGQGDAYINITKAANGNSAYFKMSKDTGAGSTQWTFGTGVSAVDDIIKLRNGDGVIIWQSRDTAAHTFDIFPATVGTVKLGGSKVTFAGIPTSDSGDYDLRYDAADGIVYNTSDGRQKTNEAPLGYGLSEILQLNPKSYTYYVGQINYKEDKKTKEYKKESIKITNKTKESFGLIAQEVWDIIPEAVYKPKDEKVAFWGLREEKLIPILINAVKELNTRIETLETA